MSKSSRGDPSPEANAAATRPAVGQDFIRNIVAEDLKAGRHGGRIVTRFPPEPNGYLHIGHATAVCLNFQIARETGGECHLRFDDTNPETEDIRFVEAIKDDIRWLGFDWGDKLFFASDYFSQMYAFGEYLIRAGKAYVDSLSEEEIREYRGTVTEPGRPSPYRDRSVEENLDLFRRMKAGEFPDGAHVLRAKLDLAAANMRMRDPVLFRIRHAHHYRTGDEWRIYPLYDFAHPIEDALECVTHSLCTLEFENSRPLYDWLVENLPRETPPLDIPADCEPRQYEFARRNLDYTVMSKRKLLQLVGDGDVSGWDDPRMPTIAGLRRRGFTPGSIRVFADLAGIGKVESRIDMGKLEFAIRDELNREAPRVLCVLRPLRVVITNYPENQTETFDAPYFPRDVAKEGARAVPFSRVLYIDRDDFMEDPPPGYHRLAPGREVRLRYAYVIRCDEVVRDDDGEIVELRCSYDGDTRGGCAPEGRSIRGTIHWVSAERAIPCQVRLYDRLFTMPDPEQGDEDFTTYLNPESLVVAEDAQVEPSVAEDVPDTRYQFERLGYFWRDPVDSRPDDLVFNRIVTLREAWVHPAATRAAGPRAAPEPHATAGAKPVASVRAPAGEPVEPTRTPELEARRRGYVEKLGIGDSEAEIITRERATTDLLDDGIAAGAPARAVANWIVHELPRELGDQPLESVTLSGSDLGKLVTLVEEQTLSSNAAREVLTEMLATGEAPDTIVERRGLRQVSDPGKLAPLVAEMIEQHPVKAREYRDGRSGLLGFFVGQVMRRTGGRANPEVVKKLLQESLSEDG